MVRLPIVLAVCTLPVLSLAQEAAPTDPPGARSTTGAIDAGVAWLLKHQEENGGWSASQFQRHDPKGDLCTGTGKPDQDLHVTAWATFALLSRGNTEREGKKEPVQKALAWLQAQQQKDGFLGATEAANAVEAHALACLALAEGKLLSGQPLPEEALKKLVALRLPDGTWPARVGGKQGDPLATYWASIACKSGEMRVDLEPTLVAIAENKLTSAPLPSAELMLRWMAVHTPAKDKRQAELIARLAEQPPRWREGAEAEGMDFLGWYLGTYGMFQAGGLEWQHWYPALLAALVPHQRTDGAHAGSWDPVDARGAQGGRVYATAVNVVSLAGGQRFGRVVVDRGGAAKKK
jgi:hypothetical protein